MSNPVARDEMVNAQDVIKIYQLLSAYDIPIWLTGGWGIDALLGKHTRPHKDLDVIMQLDDIVRLRELLAGRDYQLKLLWSENLLTRDSFGNEMDTAFVLQDSEGRELDVHAMRIDDQGNGVPAWDEAKDFIFSKQDLAGLGTIADFPVRCITPESQMRCHTGYELGEKDLHDLDLLHKKFGVAYPKGYAHRSIQRNQD